MEYIAAKELLQAKQEARELLMQRLNQIDHRQLTSGADQVRASLMALPEYHMAQCIFTYVGNNTSDSPLTLAEIATLPIIDAALRAGKRVACPLIIGRGLMEARELQSLSQLVPGRYGILAPDQGCPVLPKSEIDLVIVPGLGFDRQGHRLGRGGGYYDRYLAGFSGLKIALAWEWQLLTTLPYAEHDISVDLLISEQGVLRVRR